MSNVVLMFPENNPDIVLLEASGKFDKVLVIGILSEDGSIDARGTTGDKAELIYWIEQFKHKLLAGDYDEQV